MSDIGSDAVTDGGLPSRRIIVLNCNTNSAMTAVIGAIAHEGALPSTRIAPVTPPFGPESTEGYYESFVSAAGMLAALERQSEPFDAVILAGFGEHGREAMRQRWDVPVVDITEAGPMLAGLVSRSYGVVTTLGSTVPLIWESLHASGLDARCAGVVASGIPVTGTQDSVENIAETLLGSCKELLSSGAEAIVLGCAGFAGLDAELERRLGVPVLDGVIAAVHLAETLCRMSKSTSKSGAFSPPSTGKKWTGWQLGGRIEEER